MGPGRFGVEPPRERPDSPPKSYGVPRRGGTFIEWSHVRIRRIDPTSVIAWKAMPTPTRWRFPRSD